MAKMNKKMLKLENAEIFERRFNNLIISHLKVKVDNFHMK